MNTHYPAPKVSITHYTEKLLDDVFTRDPNRLDCHIPNLLNATSSKLELNLDSMKAINKLCQKMDEHWKLYGYFETTEVVKELTRMSATSKEGDDKNYLGPELCKLSGRLYETLAAARLDGTLELLWSPLNVEEQLRVLFDGYEDAKNP